MTKKAEEKKTEKTKKPTEKKSVKQTEKKTINNKTEGQTYKHRTFYVWLLIMLASISVVFSIPAFFQFPANRIDFFAINAIEIIIGVIFIYKLVKLPKDVFKWTHIAFIMAILGMAYFFVDSINTIKNTEPQTLIDQLKTQGQEIPPEITLENVNSLSMISASIIYIIVIMLYSLLWLTFYRHLKNCEKNKIMEFM